MKRTVSLLLTFMMILCTVPFFDTGISAEAADKTEAYTVKDVVTLQEYLVKKRDSIGSKNYDMNGDGRLNVFDLGIMKRRLLDSIKPAEPAVTTVTTKVTTAKTTTAKTTASKTTTTKKTTAKTTTTTKAVTTKTTTTTKTVTTKATTTIITVLTTTTKAAVPDRPEPKNKILVAYFSCTNNTKGIAKYITDYLGADSYEIVPEIPYTSADLNYNTDCRANREQNDDSARPAISGSVDNMDDYSTVFIGYPIWWGQAPKIIYTFCESYDLSGKTIIPFCTSGSSSMGSSASNLQKVTSGSAKWLEGRRFSGGASESSVISWVDSMELVKENRIDDGFIEIKGGRFTMGSPEDEPEREADEVQHEVTVSSFFMSPIEVTQKEYQAVMGENPSERKGEKLPVTNVSWYDAIEYCNRLSAKEGLTAAYTVNGSTVTWNRAADGYRLPTEAEWEYAARANTDTPFSFGDYVHDEDANCYNAYGYNNDSSGRWVNGYLEETAEVKSYPANPNGLYEIHGNAAEWVWDWYGEYGKKAAADPTGSAAGNYKIARGGAWNDFPKHIRSAYRSANAPDVGTYGTGMRLVRGAGEKGSVTSTFNETEQKKDKKVLIAYFSQTGNTKGLTDIIADMTGADVFRIERETPYSATSNSVILYTEALNELREFAVPGLKTSLEDAGYNIDDYDTILLGYCNWWASIPAPVRTFLKEYDMSGKTIIPYCSMGGGRFGQTVSAVAKLAPDSNIKEGLDTVYASYNKERIQKWLDSHGIEKQTAAEYFNITANGTTFKARFSDNSSADAFRELLKKGDLTISMSDYGNFEKVGSIGTTLPRNDEQITTGPGDVILYQGSSVTVYYDRNTWNFTRLGKIENVTKEELLAVFGKGDVKITFSI